jgi:hypothetical protein
VLSKIRQMVVPATERHRPIEAWIIGDTGLSQEGPAFGGRGTAVLSLTDWSSPELSK